MRPGADRAHPAAGELGLLRHARPRWQRARRRVHARPAHLVDDGHRGDAARPVRPPELAFTAGLLHDIGLLALATYFPDELSAALAHSRAEDRSLDQVERPLLGCAHAEIGAAIVSHWRLPAELCDAVRHHHGPPAAPGNAPSTLADVVHVADAVAHGLDLVGVPDEAVPETLLPSWNRLALAAAPWQRIFSHTEEGVELLCEALDLHKEPACT
ncbi:MAG: HDOD domain-containing protein [Burkholderiales bacterium]|nr:HDOD domain-containing protein [Burkholderiales bacterium]